MDMAFHSAFSPANGALPLESGDGALRPLDWGELCARLAAGRAGREAHAARVALDRRVASFNGSAARMLMRLGETGARQAADHEAAVNPTPSAAGKATGGKSLSDAGAVAAASADPSVAFE